MPTAKQPPPAPPQTPVAISYIRFSTPDQAKGDSLRRQAEATEDWCRRHGVRLDDSLALRDLGKSAYRGSHRNDKAALGQFLKLVQAGKVARGSYLVIENLDRLTREHIRPALTLLLNLIEAGVRVVQLHPVEQVFDDAVEPMTLMMAIMELSRGHSESKVKSQRIGAVWRKKKNAAREGQELLTRRLPAWVEEVGGKLELVPERAGVVKRIFELAAAGLGHGAIVKKLTLDGVAAFGQYERGEDGRRHARGGGPLGCGKWTRTYVDNVLRDRRALGEHQPRGPDGKPEGSAIAGYFPPAVPERLYWAAVAGCAGRRPKRSGRIGKHINLFRGLIRNARPVPGGQEGFGATYVLTTRNDRGKMTPVLQNAAHRDGLQPSYSFPYETFERAILSRLCEADPREVLAPADDKAGLADLEGELAWVRGKKAELQAELLKGDIAVIAAALRDLEAREAELSGKVDQASAEQAKPIGGTWRDIVRLAGARQRQRRRLAALDDEEDATEARLRLQAAIRRVVESIWLLVTRRGTTRLAFVQVNFAGGAMREYRILHRPPVGNGKGPRRPGRWFVESLKHDDPREVVDIRGPEDAARVLKSMEESEHWEHDGFLGAFGEVID